jgi:hypothetical protein
MLLLHKDIRWYENRVTEFGPTSFSRENHSETRFTRHFYFHSHDFRVADFLKTSDYVKLECIVLD